MTIRGHSLPTPTAGDGSELDVEALERLLPRYSEAGPRYTSYPTVPVWEADFAWERHARALEAVPMTDDVAVYAHIPFCASLCHFCACNRVITRDPALPERYLDTIDREVAVTRARIPGPGRCRQLHWGGGTPTHLEPAQLARLFGSLTQAFPLTDDAEVSIEVDPRVTTEEQIELLADCGFNRISLGVQDTNEKTQAAIHRIQPFTRTLAVTEAARARGIEGVNYDLVYGLPHQTEASFSRTLDDVLLAAPDRIALYAYAHVTWVAKQQRGFERSDLPEPARRIRILTLAIRRLLEAGYRYIGMDHFARPDDELSLALEDGTLRRNFMGYTTKEGLDVVAFGPSAISELGPTYVQVEKDLKQWLARTGDDHLATSRGLELSEDDLVRRWIIGRIMCEGRVDDRELRARFGRSLAVDFAPALDRLAPMIEDGLVETDDAGNLVVRPLGRLLVRNVAMVFDAYLEPDRADRERRFSQTV